MQAARPGEDGERPLSHRGLSGTGDTRTSTLNSQRSTPGSKPVKANHSPVLRERRSEEMPCEEDACEDLFNSTFRLTPERIWKPTHRTAPLQSIIDSDPSSSPLLPARVPSALRKLRAAADPAARSGSAERRMPIIQSRRIIRTAKNVPNGQPVSGWPASSEKYDLLLPPKFRK